MNPAIIRIGLVLFPNVTQLARPIHRFSAWNVSWVENAGSLGALAPLFGSGVMGVGVSGHLCSRGNRPGFHGPAGWRQPAMPRNKAASGKEVAKATRTRVAVSVIRAAILSRCVRRVVNSAVANVCCLGMASRTVSMSQ